MENGVNRFHGVQKLEGKGVGSCLSDNGIRPKVLLGEFLRGPSGPEVLSFDEDLITDFEVRRRRSFSISGSLIAFLGMGHLLTEELVEGVEVNGVLSCSSRGKISFWIDRDVRVVTFIGKEW